MKVLFCDNSLRSLINFRNDVICSYAKDGWEVVLVAPKDFEYHPDYGNIKYIEVKMHRSSKNIFKDTLYLQYLSERKAGLHIPLYYQAEYLRDSGGKIVQYPFYGHASWIGLCFQ